MNTPVKWSPNFTGQADYTDIYIYSIAADNKALSVDMTDL